MAVFPMYTYTLLNRKRKVHGTLKGILEDDRMDFIIY